MKPTYNKSLDLARIISEVLHNGQRYGDGEDYTVHLQTVYEVLIEFNCEWEHVKIASYLHDVPEDTQCSLKLIKKYFGEDVEHVVYLVTNEQGKDRKERNSKTYQKLANQEDGVMLKLADRIANTRHSRKQGGKFFEMYAQEFAIFKYFLYNEAHCEVVQNMWKELERISKPIESCLF